MSVGSRGAGSLIHPRVEFCILSATSSGSQRRDAEGGREYNEGRRKWRWEKKFCSSTNVPLTVNLPPEGRK